MLRLMTPVVALTPVPVVVADASVTAPWVIATVNWSATFTRPLTLLSSVTRGLARLSNVQVITSPAAGVMLNELPRPLGNVVPVPAVVFVHEMELL